MLKALRNDLPDDCLELRVSRIIVEELTRAGVWKKLDFPLLMPQNDGASMLWIPVTRAQEMVELCGAEQQRDDLRQGLKKAFTHVTSNLRDAIFEFDHRGLIEDPGYENVRSAAHDCGQQFQVGDRVFHEYLQEHVEIVGGYAFRMVKERAGLFYKADGQPFSYRYGYAIQAREGKIFASAGELSDPDCKPRHLILVRAYGEAVVQAQ